jgi:hypothetical protein
VWWHFTRLFSLERIAIMAVRRIKDRVELALAGARLHQLAVTITARDANLKLRTKQRSKTAELDKIKIGRLNRQDCERALTIWAKMYAFANPLRSELAGEMGSEAPADTCTLQWRTIDVGALTYTNPDETEGNNEAVDELLAMLERGVLSQEDFDDIVRTVRTIRKDPLKDRPEILAQMKSASAGSVNYFGVAFPDGTKSFRRPVAIWKNLAMKLGLE